MSQIPSLRGGTTTIDAFVPSAGIPLSITQVHSTPTALGGSEESLRISVDALRAGGLESSLLCATLAGPSPMPAVDKVTVSPGLFAAEPASPLAVRRLARQFTATLSELEPDVVHIRLGIRPELVAHITRHWPVVYSAHTPVCPNGARYWYRSGLVCERAVGTACVTYGYRLQGCGHLLDRSQVSLPAFVRSLHTTSKLLKALNMCRFVIASSAWQAERLARDGIARARLVVVPPPIVALSGNRLGQPPAIAFAGRLAAIKGADHLLRATAQVGGSHRVWIIGDGPERSKLERLAAELGISDRVKFFGRVAPDDTHELMAAATVVVVPSLGAETFNQAGAQAAVAGRRVVAYDAAGVREWADRCRNVSLVPAGNWPRLAQAIERVLERADDAPAVQMNHFSSDRHGDALVRLYQDAASRSGAATEVKSSGTPSG